MFIFIIIVLIIIRITFCAPSLGSVLYRNEVQHGVETRNNFLRDNENAKRVHVQIEQKSNTFQVKVRKEDNTPLILLSLSPGRDCGIFTSNFKLTEIDVNENGELVFVDDPLTYESHFLNNVSSQIFVDPKFDAVFKLQKHPTFNEFALEGILNEYRIYWDDSENLIQHFMHPIHSTLKRKRKRRSAENMEDIDFDKFHPLQWTNTAPSLLEEPPLARASLQRRSSCFFLTMKIRNCLTGNKLLDYASVLVNAVNNRYATNTDLSVNFVLAGIATTKSIEAEKHFEKAKVQGRYVAIKLLEALSYWVFEQKKELGKYDILVVLTSVPFEGQTTGIAYVESACWNQKSPSEMRDMSVALVRDAGGIWNGAITVTHELAHTLGAPHDGSGKSTSCKWADGYLMSYDGWGSSNKYRFSECSRRCMREFIVSSGGSCLKFNSVPKNLLTSSDTLGKRMSMEELCRKVTGKPDASVVDDDADSMCRMLQCKYSSGKGMYTIEKLSTLIGNDASCGKGGKCKDGFCIGNQQKPIVDQSEKNRICQEKMDKNAVSIDASDFPPDRQCNSIKCKISKPNGAYSWQQVEVFLGNGVPCNKSGKCQAGKCVTS